MINTQDRMAWVKRWLFSTNCKEIAILYIIFAVFAGLIGTGLSLIIRLELAGPSPQILFHNGQLFNVVISAHAVMMIFFLVMPMTMGFFANSKKRCYNKNDSSPPLGGWRDFFKDKGVINITELTESGEMTRNNINKENPPLGGSNENLKTPQLRGEYWGPYLAGLIESDGCITVHDKDTNVNRYSPHISIVFKRNDTYIAEFLCTLTKCGKIENKKERGYVLWKIDKIEEVYKIILLINGYMRTPKHEALVRAIKWINEYIEETKESKLPKTIVIRNKINTIEIKEMDESPLESNAWLSGMTDGDGNFTISIYKDKRINFWYRLKLRQTYRNKYLTEGKSYHGILNKIAVLFKGKVYGYETPVIFNGIKNTYYSYIMDASNKKSLALVLEYFDTYPLLSSKYLDYKDWSSLIRITLEEGQSYNTLQKAKEIRKDYNKTRQTLNWKHLYENDNLFYTHEK